MFGSHHFGFKLNHDIKEAVARKKFSEVSDRYGLDIDDVNVEFDDTLPYDVLGRTAMPRYSEDGLTVSVGEKFLEADERRQEKTMLHEGIHVKQFQDEVDEWLREEFNASEDFVREVEKSSDPLYEKEIEGITEVLTDTILPFEAGTGYPYEKRSKMSELNAKGIDVESELMQDIDEEFGSLAADYNNVYDSFEVGDLYIETGNFAGLEYAAVASGYENGECLVNEYLVEIGLDEGFPGKAEAGFNEEKYYAV